MSVVRSELLAVVERSPRSAADNDRAGWVGLFTADGRVEDPVGSRPHRGSAQLGRFYDTFIAPRRIVFHRDVDIVAGSTVIRDLELEVGMGPSVTMRIPAVLRYDLRDVAGDWKIERLRAYWELPAMVLRFAANGLPAGPQALQLARALIRNQGLGGSVGFAAGFRGPRVRGKRAVRGFLEAIAAGDELGARRYLAPAATITAGTREALRFTALRDELGDRRPTRLLGAGSFVAVSLRGARPGVLIAELATGGRAITRLRYFAE